jgi:UDP-3-O-[3-hydroxymyristoyl] N-acetylglucosamine deacetylase
MNTFMLAHQRIQPFEDVQNMVSTTPNLTIAQTTLAESITYIGVGLHNGRTVVMDLQPAPPNSGVRFVRKDVPTEQSVIRARWSNVVDTRLSTVLGNEHGVTVATVEHLLAALRGCGIDNVIVELNASEVPILDGSSEQLVATIERAGMQYQAAPSMGIWIERPVEVQLGESYASITPDNTSRISVEIDFESPAIGLQSLSIELVDNVFQREIAPARTFGFAYEIRHLHEQGLALGGSLRNAVLIDDDRVVNAEGLRFEDEFARHKLLDCLGDLALAEAPIYGHFHAHRPGHRLNNVLLRELFAHKNAWSLLGYEQIRRRLERGDGEQQFQAAKNG